MRISVVTVSYNSSKTIESTIESVLNQKNLNFEYIIVDGDSKDGTIEILQRYESVFMEKNISYHWVSEKDKGIYDAMNKGLELASGDVIGYLNSDDAFYDDTALLDIETVFEKQHVDCCYGNLIFVNSDGKIVRNWISKEYRKGLFQKSWTPAHPTFYCKKKIYEKFGKYRLDYKIAADVDLMFRFLEINMISSFFLNRYIVKMSNGGVSTQGLKSTYIITKEVGNSIKEQGLNFNLLKYLFFKFIKIIEQQK